jgi:hypothetical protein
MYGLSHQATIIPLADQSLSLKPGVVTIASQALIL